MAFMEFLTSNTYPFADDTSPFKQVNNEIDTAVAYVNNDLQKIKRKDKIYWVQLSPRLKINNILKINRWRFLKNWIE